MTSPVSRFSTLIMTTPLSASGSNLSAGDRPLAFALILSSACSRRCSLTRASSAAADSLASLTASPSWRTDCSATASLAAGARFGVSPGATDALLDAAEAEGLPSNTVLAILQDREDGLWFGTAGGGVCQLPHRRFAYLSRDDGLPSDSRHFGHIAYGVDNIYETCQHLADNGVVINRPPRDGRMAFVKTPDGVSVELLQIGDPLPAAEGSFSLPLDQAGRVSGRLVVADPPAACGLPEDWFASIVTADDVTRYKPDVLWWDTPRWMTQERAETLIPLIRVVPGIIINNRLGGGYEGDTETPEQHIPAVGFKDRDWEVCMTMNRTWGYSDHDHNWKSNETLIRNLIDIASKGGNYLLNVVPNVEGLIPDASVERLRETMKTFAGLEQGQRPGGRPQPRRRAPQAPPALPA